MDSKITVSFSGSINASFDVDPITASKLLVYITSGGSTSDLGIGLNTEVETSKSKPVKSNRKRLGFSTSASKPLREEVKSLEVVPELVGFPDFHKVSKSDQVLWLLIFAKENKIESLSSAEISFLASRLSINISSKNISGLTETARLKGRMIRNSDGTLKVFKPGIDYLKDILSN
jgi:hypothetical protein